MIKKGESVSAITDMRPGTASGGVEAKRAHPVTHKVTNAKRMNCPASIATSLADPDANDNTAGISARKRLDERSRPLVDRRVANVRQRFQAFTGGR